MYISDLFENENYKKVVVLSGGYHPWTPGHSALYQSAVKAFPDADVWVAATNDTKTRPFPFEVKKQLAIIAGVPEDRFIQVRIPFKPDEVTAHYDPNNTVLIYCRSEKDAGDIKIGGNKKDGSPAYIQPYNPTNLQPLTKHGYMKYLPTVQYKAGSTGITGATQIREMWPTANSKMKQQIVADLYPKTRSNPALVKKVIKLLDSALGSPMQVGEDIDVQDSVTIPGWGQITVAQAEKEMSALMSEMKGYIADRNYSAANEYNKKIEPFAQALRQYWAKNAQHN
jgi:hypothetical protein